MTKNKNSTKYLSDRQELAVSQAVGGHRTPMSGAGRFIKSDIVLPFMNIECKTQMTEKASFSVKKEWLDKMVEEGYQMGKPFSALAFNFGGEENIKDNYYILNQRDFCKFIELIKEEWY